MAAARAFVIILTFLCCSFQQGQGFSSLVASNCGSTRKRSLISDKNSSTVGDGEEDLHETKAASATTLNLFGEVTIRSEGVPPPHERIHEFFTLPESASLLLRGSNNNEVVEITSVDDQLREAYQEQCRKINASTPSSEHNERFYDVTTSAVKFPGLQINSLASIGTKVIKEGHAGFPAYEFVLIRDSTYAEGNRLFVWFFNKVTGKDKGAKGEDQTTQSLNIVRVLPMEDGSIAFECNANLSISIEIPAVLMKIIPNKEKAEKTGGDSLRATLKGDIPSALSSFREEYIKWRDINS